MGFVSRCRDCGASDKKLSHKRLCIDCSMARQVAVGMQIKDRKGDYFKKYKAAMIKYLSKDR